MCQMTNNWALVDCNGLLIQSPAELFAPAKDKSLDGNVCIMFRQRAVVHRVCVKLRFPCFHHYHCSCIVLAPQVAISILVCAAADCLIETVERCLERCAVQATSQFTQTEDPPKKHLGQCYV